VDRARTFNRGHECVGIRCRCARCAVGRACRDTESIARLRTGKRTSRAGWGQSEAVVVVCQPEGEAGGQPPSSSVKEGGGRKAAALASKSNWPSREAAVERFISGKWCRRVVLDQVMDGQYDRAGCRCELEAECNIYMRQRDRVELEDGILWIEREGDMKV
jgi:hypothetical protein